MAHIETVAGIEPAVVINDDDRSYVDWPAIFAGTVLATAISFVLLTFGSAIGLSMSSARAGEGTSLFWVAVVGALWLLWVQISSFTAGGYLTGRLRRRHGDSTESESDIRDGSHGLVMWALGVLLGAFIAFWGISGTISAAGSAASAVGSGVANVATEAADQFGADSLLVDRALRGGANANQPVDEGTRSEIGRILASTLGDGELDQGDRDYLVSVVSQRAGIPPEEAQARIDQVVEQGRALEAQARDAAETARKTTLIAAFLAAASLLVSGAAAYFGATLGGKHRDEHTVFADWNRPW
ncbi:hypothetical protein [Mesorhizobium sp. CAU 1732]|uniref:hypothetical protein n=1 Tax=Mesorhizobium sp. CAU 1732 TaxID=3140358 RepID=UPI00325FF22C